MIRRGYIFTDLSPEEDGHYAMTIKEYVSPKTGVKYLARFLTDDDLMRLVNENEDTIVKDPDTQTWDSQLFFIDEKTGLETKEGDTKTYEGVIIDERYPKDPACRFVNNLLSYTPLVQHADREDCSSSLRWLGTDLNEEVFDRAVAEHLWKIEGKRWWFKINTDNMSLKFGIKDI